MNYDFGFAKAFFGAQYGKNEVVDVLGTAGNILSDPDADATLPFDGYNLHIGATAPVFGGELQVSAFYGDYEYTEDDHITADKYGVAAMYLYPVSKRTTVYAGAGWSQFNIKVDGFEGLEDQAGRQKGVDVAFGLTHRF